MTLIVLPETHEPGRPIDTPAAERAAAELLGVVRDDPPTRQEFLALTTRNDHA